jgi:hypothetical protein
MVGAKDTNWRDKALSSTIISHQKKQMKGFVPTRSHAEWITDSSGGTFAARWRTRHRPEGLKDYIDSAITIGRAPALTKELFDRAWKDAELDEQNGKIYPVHRLLLQGVSTWIFPWITNIGTGSFLICSEIISKLLHSAHKIVKGSTFEAFAGQWQGNTPAHLEQQVVDSDDWIKVFNGVLTPRLYTELTGRQV